MTAVDLVHSALEAHGVRSRIEGGQVLLLDAPLAFEPLVSDGPPNEKKIVQLDLIMQSPRVAPRFIVESMAGVGLDQSAAERDAFLKFLLGAFHVLLTALADHSCSSNPAEWLHWTSSRGTWRVCDGPVLKHGAGEIPSTYVEFMKRLEALFAELSRDEPHWVSVFIGSLNESVTGLNVILDNERWSAAENLARQLDWHCPGGYRSLRHFFIAFPDAR